MMSSDINAEWSSAALLSGCLQELQELRALLSNTYKYPRGYTMTSILHLKAADRVTRIDFMNRRNFQNIPTTGNPDTAGGADLVATIGVPVSRIIIYNLGPGGMYFDTNRNINDLTADTPIDSGAHWEIASDYPSIVSINLKAANADAKARMTAIV
jgi:hypothetical protein